MNYGKEALRSESKSLAVSDVTQIQQHMSSATPHGHMSQSDHAQQRVRPHRAGLANQITPFI